MSGIRSRRHTGSIWATLSGSRWATVDNETRVGREAFEARPRRRLGSEVREHAGHGRPAAPGLRIVAVVAVAGPIGDPPGCPTAGHRDRHPMAPRGDHVAERRDLHDPSQGGDAGRCEALCEAAEKHCPRRKSHVLHVFLEQIADHFAS